MNPTTQDNLATQALNLIQELDDIDDDNENSARVEELQVQLNEIQTQLANTTNESISEVPEQSTSNLDTQIAEEVRKKELNKISSTLANVEVDDEAYYSKTLTQINQLQDSNVLTEQEANGFRQLLDVKIAIKALTSEGVNSQIINGKKGSNNLETNLGIKDYQEIFTLARSNGQVPIKMLDYLTRFRDDHVSKANAIMEAVSVHDGVNPITIAYSNKSNSWEITEEDEHFKKHPKEYVELDFNSTDPEIRRVVRMLPYSFKAETKKLYGNKVKTYPVHKSMFTATFGYQAYSIVNIWDKLDNNAKLNVAEKLIKSIFDFWFKENGRKRALQGERYIQELMSLIKDIIVIRSGGVLVGNILSNTYLLMTQGINPIRILKDSTFAWRNVKQYRNQANRIEEINALLLTTKSNQEKSKLNREKSQLEQSLNRNPLKDYMDAGLMSTIVEDLVGNTDTGYKSALQKKVDSYVDLIPKPIQKGLNEVTMGQGSKLHNLLSEATQFSDFSAKYTLAKFHLEKGMDREKAIYEAQLSFINFDIPTNQFLDYMNRLGLMVFTKFFLRFQRMLTKVAINAPVSSIIGHYAVEYAGGQGLYDPFILNRLGNPLDGSVLLLPDAVGSVLTNPF